jgi:hypothetical protein
MAKPPPFDAKTNAKENSVVDDKLRPTAEMQILIGGAYVEAGGEEHKYGHTALYIKTANKEYIYDFGRYGHTYSEDLGMGIVLTGPDSPKGEGILNIWESLNTYIASENSYGRTTWGYKYFIFDAQAVAAKRFYESLIEGKEPIKLIIKGKEQKTPFKRYKLATDYFALGPNCTTLSIEGAKKAVPKIDENSEEFIEPTAVLSK